MGKKSNKNSTRTNSRVGTKTNSSSQRKIVVYSCCNPKCIFFPNKEIVPWEYVDYGGYSLKRRALKDESSFKCGYSGKSIKDWTSPCPFYKEVVEYQQEKLKENFLENSKEPPKESSKDSNKNKKGRD